MYTGGRGCVYIFEDGETSAYANTFIRMKKDTFGLVKIAGPKMSFLLDSLKIKYYDFSK